MDIKKKKENIIQAGYKAVDELVKVAKEAIVETDDDVSATTMSEVEKVTKNVIASVDVAGYNPKEMEIFPTGTQFRAFVLLEYSEEEARKIIMNRMMKDRMVYGKIRSTNAWKELEDSVKKSKVEDEVTSMSNIETEINKVVNAE